MTIYNWPDGIRIASQTFQLSQNVQTFSSPLIRSTQRIQLKGAQWTATYTLTPHNRAEFAAFQAFLIKLQGGVNTFYGRDFDAEKPRGVATGTPLVSGAGQTGLTLVTDGWTPNVTGILKAGDYIQVGNELKMITDDANSDSSGIATLNISHTFRTSPGDDAPIITNKASCVMRLIDSNQDAWQTDQNNLYTITFQAVETFV